MNAEQKFNKPTKPAWNGSASRIVSGSSVAPPTSTSGQTAPSVIETVKRAVGARYSGCTLKGFVCKHPRQSEAVASTAAFASRWWKSRGLSGESIIWIGPPGTGKDHLMVAMLMQLLEGSPRLRVIYRDGLTMFSEFRSAFDQRGVSEDDIVAKYVDATLLAISDPVPPRGTLSEYEQRMLYRIIDGRYRQKRSIAATINVANRVELDTRLGPQAADRLCDGAEIVQCNWPSYRGAR